MSKSREEYEGLVFGHPLNPDTRVKDMHDFLEQLPELIQEMMSSVVPNLIAFDPDVHSPLGLPEVELHDGAYTIPPDASAQIQDQLFFVELANRFLCSIRGDRDQVNLRRVKELWWAVCLGAMGARLKLRNFEDLVAIGKQQQKIGEELAKSQRKSSEVVQREIEQFAKIYNRISEQNPGRGKSWCRNTAAGEMKFGETKGKALKREAIQQGLIPENK